MYVRVSQVFTVVDEVLAVSSAAAHKRMSPLEDIPQALKNRGQSAFWPLGLRGRLLCFLLIIFAVWRSNFVKSYVLILFLLRVGDGRLVDS